MQNVQRMLHELLVVQVYGKSQWLSFDIFNVGDLSIDTRQYIILVLEQFTLVRRI